MISDEEIGDYDKEALIREEYMVVTVTHDGYIKRLPPSTYRAQGRGGRGIAATNTKEGDFLEHMFVALTHDYILFFTDKGKVYWHQGLRPAAWRPGPPAAGRSSTCCNSATASGSPG